MNDPIDHGATPRFLDLWPTQLMHIRLPGADAANPFLAGVLMERNAGLEDMTVVYTSDNLFSSEHPAVQWLHQCCNSAILDYADQRRMRRQDIEFGIAALPVGKPFHAYEGRSRFNAAIGVDVADDMASRAMGRRHLAPTFEIGHGHTRQR